MKLTDCATALKECGPGAKITLEGGTREPLVLTMAGADLLVTRSGKEAFRVSFAHGGVTVSHSAVTARDATDKCIQDCRDKCGDQLLCMDLCTQKCF
jgi:hypothetical protein